MSAVKAIQIAQEQGQTVYTITKDNYSQVLPKLNLSSHVMTDIRNAINAGRTVTTHEKSIQYKGWHGSGYIVLDPHSGTGAYLIDGGANGGFAFVVGLMIGVLIQTILIGIQSKLFVGISGAAIAELTMVLAPVVIMLTILVGLILINDDKNHTGLICLGAGISAGVGTTAVLDSLFLSKVLYSGALGGAIGTGPGLLGIGSCF